MILSLRACYYWIMSCLSSKSASGLQIAGAGAMVIIPAPFTAPSFLIVFLLEDSVLGHLTLEASRLTAPPILTERALTKWASIQVATLEAV